MSEKTALAFSRQSDEATTQEQIGYVTSRASLRLRGEREYVVGPLDLQTRAEVMSLADLARVPAVRLFMERVRDVRSDFRLTPANGPTATIVAPPPSTSFRQAE